MKKVAILSDIHGNSVALKAVLTQIEKFEIRDVIILGDFVGYYHQPKEVLDLLASANLRIIAVQGNHERMLGEVLRGKKKWSEINCRYGHGLMLANEQLEKCEREWLLNLPMTRELIVGKSRVLLSHVSPMLGHEYIYPDSNFDEMDFSGCCADILIMGHTHYQMIGVADGKLIINPGSVGQSRRYGGVAEWAVLYEDNCMVVPQAAFYDVDKVIEDCRRYDEDVPYLSEVLRRGK